MILGTPRKTQLPVNPREARQVFGDAIRDFAQEHLGPGMPRTRLVLIVDGIDEIVQHDA